MPKPKSNNTRNYLISLSERAAGYLFPLFLLTLEWVLRYAFQLNTSEFIGPTLAATGVGMTITLTAYQSNKIYQEIPPELRDFIAQNKLRVETTASGVFRNICWIASLGLTLLWVASILLSTKSANTFWWVFPIHYYPGIVSYIIGFFLAEMKEAV